MQLLVTGGSGFIGAHVVRRALAAGDDVTVLDLLPPQAGAGDVRWVPGDVRDPAAVADAVRGSDVVVHLAAKVGLGGGVDDLEEYVSVNDAGTAAVLVAAARAQVPRLVFASSMVVYGEGAYDCGEHGRVPAAPRRREDLEAGRFEPRCPCCAEPLVPGLVAEDAPADPRNAYAATKLHGEHLSAGWARETGGTSVALRFHNVYGPGMPLRTAYAGVAALFRAQIAAGGPPRVFEDGAQRRDFVHVRDVAAAVVLATRRGSSPGSLRAYNTGSGTVRTVAEVAGALSTALGGPAPLVTGEFRLGDVRHVTADSARAGRELGWRAVEEFSGALADLGG